MNVFRWKKSCICNKGRLSWRPQPAFFCPVLWRQSRKYPDEGNDRFFNFAVSLRSAGMSALEIEVKLREEATFGRSAYQRRAQIPSIMSTLTRSCKKSA